MKILITGASGLLGKYLLKTQPTREGLPEGVMEYKYEIIPCYRNNYIEGGLQLDVSSQSDVLDKLWKIQPDIIIHCAANGDVDSVEDNSSEAVRSDLLGTIHLKDYCEKMDCKLITISTNAVYDGRHSPYSEEAIRAPINFYGKIKSLADDIIMKSNCDWIIIRPIFMYGWNWKHGRDNWATKIIKFLREGKQLKLVGDSYTQPTYAGEVAEFIWLLIKNNKWKEDFNVSSGEDINIYAFGLDVAESFELDKKYIFEAKLSDFTKRPDHSYVKSIAPRPLNTCFNTEKIRTFKWYPDAKKDEGFKFSNIKEGLKKMKFEWDTELRYEL